MFRSLVIASGELPVPQVLAMRERYNFRVAEACRRCSRQKQIMPSLSTSFDAGIDWSLQLALERRDTPTFEGFDMRRWLVCKVVARRGTDDDKCPVGRFKQILGNWAGVPGFRERVR